MSTALVTGASAGLGREFAEQLAVRGHDLVLVARDEARLQDVAASLRESHGVDVEVLVADLGDRDQTQRVADRVADPERPVDLVVNNAGFGLGSAFVDGDLAESERALEVMVRAVLVISHAAAGAMRVRGHGAIVNVSSVAGFVVTGPYSAIKSWVTVFSEGLAVELRGTGVTVTAVCPGLVHTEFHARAATDMARVPAVSWSEAPDVVRVALADVAAGRVVSLPTRRYRLLTHGLRIVPRRLVRAASVAAMSLRRDRD